MESNDNKTTDKGNNIKGIKFILTIGRQHRWPRSPTDMY
jgi:hypothetical protein